ncbi:hypothetical protein BDQ17DRAFT_1346260 [Cyathus striatus]|nr:hypothetical protein BDQ17DRAFT_1346260 [Cyathus striatus]
MNDAAKNVYLFSYIVHIVLIFTLITLYDHVCTVDAEVKYIWRKRWSSSKILFIATRYIGDLFVIFQCYSAFLSRPSQNVCSIAYNIVIPSGVCSLIYLCQATLCFRLSALYNNSRQFVRGISLMFLLEVSTTVTIVIYRLKNSSVIVKDLHGTAICLLVHDQINSRLVESLYWMTIILFETIILSLTLWKFVFDIRCTPALRRSSLSRLIVRDNILYFIATFILYLSVGVTSWVFETRLIFAIFACFVPSFSATVGCRLILHLSEVHEHDVHDRRNVWSSDVRAAPFRTN